MAKRRSKPHQWVREDQLPPPEEAGAGAEGEAEEESPYKSRTQLRNEARALDDLAEELVGLPPGRLRALPLSDELREGIALAKRITSHEASRRQNQYLGRLLRDVDVEALRAALADGPSEQHRRAVRWRDRILSRGEDAIDAFLAEHPDADRQQIRALWRLAQQDPDKSGELLRHLHRAATPSGRGTPEG